MAGTGKTTIRNRRRFWISTLFLFFYTLIGWMRFQQSLRYWYALIELGIWPHPLYSTISGGLIGIGYGLALFFHLARWKHTARYFRILSIIFLAWLWIDRVWIIMRESFRSLLPVTILITLCTIGLDLLLIRKMDYTK